MKALLVADNKLVIDNISQILETAGYDVIIYNWLLKALDNVEEISPHLIVVSAKDYPRHWKTLAQYASMGFRSYKPQVILYAEGGLSEEDLQKAKTLNIRGVFESVDVKGLDQLRNILTKESDIFSGNLTEDEIPTVGALLTENQEKDEEQSHKLNEDELTKTAEKVAEESFQAAQKIEVADSEENVQEEQFQQEDKIELTAEEEFSKLNAQEITEESAGNNTTELNKESNFEVSTQEQPIQEMSAESLNKVENIQNSQDITENTLEAEEASTDKLDSTQKNLVCSFMFTNPLSGELVTGYAFNFDGKTFIFKADIPEFVSNLSIGTQISCASLKLSEEIKTVQSLVRENAAEMLLELV